MSSKAAQALARARALLVRRNWRMRAAASPAFTNTSAGRISADTMRFNVTGDSNWLVNTSSARSFSYWIRSNDGAWKGGAFHFCVGNTSAGPGSRNNALMFGTRDSTPGQWAGRIPTSADGATQDWLWTAPTATAGVWYHVLVVVDFSQSQANRMRLYVNGSLVTTASAGSTATAFLGSVQSFTIGSNASGANTRTLNDSSFDEFAIYNTALTAADAVEHYNGRTPRNLALLASATGLMSYWRFGDTSGDTTSAINDVMAARTLNGVGSPTFQTF